MMIEHNNGGTSCGFDSNGGNMSGRCADNYIPDDLIIEVLSRLPEKTRVRFMSVSKSWCNLISKSLLLSPMSGLLLSGLSPPCDKHPDRFIPLLPSGSNSNCLEALQSHRAFLRTCNLLMVVTDHCNGLFLLSGDRSLAPTRAYYVCNPATNQCVALPKAPPFSVWCCRYAALLFDPRKSRHYKVLLRCCYSDFELGVQIFSLDNNQWVSFSTYLRTCIRGSKSYFLDLYYPFIYLNGALHFFCNLGNCMVSFYVEEKRLQEFELPDVGCKLRTQRRTQRLGKSEGRMYYAACGHDELQIWMLQSRDPDKWFKKHTLHVANFGKAISPSNHSVHFNIVAFHTNMEVLFINQGGVIFSFYFGSGRKDSDRLEEIYTIGRNPCIRFASPCTRCLVPLKDVLQSEKLINAVPVGIDNKHLSSHPLT